MREKECPKCRGTMTLTQCGCFVCDDCDHHDGLARCFCGWSLSGGDGRAELEEMGETIDDDY